MSDNDSDDAWSTSSDFGLDSDSSSSKENQIQKHPLHDPISVMMEPWIGSGGPRPDPGMALSVAKDVDALVKSRPFQYGSEQILPHLWQWIINYSRVVPYELDDSEHEMLCLVKALKRLPPTQVSNHVGEQVNMWSDLPFYDLSIRHMSENALFSFMPKRWMADSALESWPNMISFVARVGLPKDYDNFIALGCRVMRLALEDRFPADGSPMGVPPKQFDYDVWKCALAACGQWIEHAGYIFWQLIRDPDVDLRRYVPSRYHPSGVVNYDERNDDIIIDTGLYYQGPRGLSANRWFFWMNRLDTLRDMFGQMGEDWENLSWDAAHISMMMVRVLMEYRRMHGMGN